jgi:predicted TIM-barrel fold metal-dependent hydrolase
MSVSADPSSPEPIIDPALPIVDAHHHLWDRRRLIEALPPPRHPFDQVLRLTPRYLLDELLGDMGSGHNVVATVYMECGSMYRSGGPAALRPVGETEFVNGVAAMAASGTYGDANACAAIVGHADLTLGDAVRSVLEAHLACGGGRFRGVRQSASWDEDPEVLGPLARVSQGLYRSAAFRRGFEALEPLGLSFDAWLLEPQLEDLIDLADAFPLTRIVLDHVGTPLGVGRYAGRRDERFEVWRRNILSLAERPQVVVKLGGLAMPFAGFEPSRNRPLSAALAELWRPYVETCIEAFGVSRCLFESNFPVDRVTCDYAVLWNALKQTVSGCSGSEKAALFSQTAMEVYGLSL